jgi:hypothetical protein
VPQCCHRVTNNTERSHRVGIEHLTRSTPPLCPLCHQSHHVNAGMVPASVPDTHWAPPRSKRTSGPSPYGRHHGISRSAWPPWYIPETTMGSPTVRTMRYTEIPLWDMPGQRWRKPLYDNTHSNLGVSQLQPNQLHPWRPVGPRQQSCRAGGSPTPGSCGLVWDISCGQVIWRVSYDTFHRV